MASGLAGAALLLAVTASAGRESPAEPRPAESLDQLVETSGVNVARHEASQGFYILSLYAGPDAVPVVAKETTIGRWKNRDQKIVRVTTILFKLDAGFTPPPALLREMAEANLSTPRGTVGISEDLFVFTSSFWLDGATGSTLWNELTVVQNLVPRLRERFAPYVGG